MPQFLVESVEGVTVDPKSGETQLHLRADGACLTLTVRFSRKQAEELCEKLYEGFCALAMRGQDVLCPEQGSIPGVFEGFNDLPAGVSITSWHSIGY